MTELSREQKTHTMKPFPGHIIREPWGKYGKKTFTDEQIAWLRDVYPYYPNQAIAKAMGLTVNAMRHTATQLHLHKDKDYLLDTQRKSMSRMVAHNYKTGLYRSEAYCAQSKKWREAGTRAWKKKLASMSEEERNDYYLRRGRATKATHDADKRRVRLGLPQRTKYRNFSWPYNGRHYQARSKARTLNYIVPEQPSGAERYKIYYDSLTHRSARFERNAAKIGFDFIEDR